MPEFGLGLEAERSVAVSELAFEHEQPLQLRVRVMVGSVVET